MIRAKLSRLSKSSKSRKPSLPYPITNDKESAVYACPPGSNARRRLNDWRQRANKSPSKPRAPIESIVSTHTQARRLEDSDIAVIVCVRNGAPYIPLFLSHYRSIGITRFIVLDNGSTDATVELLAGEPDVDLHSTPLDFREACCGDIWRQALLDLYGRGRWYVVVDIDELLVYHNSENRPLSVFTRSLQARGVTCALGPMIDVYPDGPLDNWKMRETRTLDALKPILFDTEGYDARFKKTGIRISGGPRSRVFQSAVPLEKYPLLRVDDQTDYLIGNIHAPAPAHRNFGPPRCALLHLKFSQESVGQIRAIASGEAFHSRAQNMKAHYRELAASAALDKQLNLRCEHSGVYTSYADLVKYGLAVE